MEDQLELEIQARLLVVEQQSAAESDSDDEFQASSLARKAAFLLQHDQSRKKARRGIKETLGTLGKGERLISEASGIILQQATPEQVQTEKRKNESVLDLNCMIERFAIHACRERPKRHPIQDLMNLAQMTVRKPLVRCPCKDRYPIRA